MVGRAASGERENEPILRPPATDGRTGMREGLRRSLVLPGAAAVALLLAGCVPAVVAGSVFVVGATSAVVFSGCDEPAAVQVWDHTASHPVCDATVTAESESGSVTTFSPCYQAYLGTGTWKVTASKPGLPIATGTVIVSEDRKCSRPSFHSLDLTLGSDGTIVSTPPPPSLAPATTAPPTPATSPAPAGAPPPPPATPPAPPPTSSGSPPPAPSPSVPSAAFPSDAPVSAPPTR